MQTRVAEMLGAEFPIFAFSHCRDVVAAVSRAGGIGVMGAVRLTPQQLKIELDWIDQHVDGRPYGVDFLLPSDYEGDDVEALEREIPAEHRAFIENLESQFGIPPRNNPGEPSELGGGDGLVSTHAHARELIEVALEHPMAVAVSALGPFPADLAERFERAGVRTAGMVGQVKHVQKHVDAGTDIIIAVGTEAAGHTGDITTTVLVPQVVDAAGDIPVIAAGGVGDGRQIASALALGAEGVWTGSIWLTTAESDLDPSVQEKLFAATSQDTVRSRCASGKPVRQLVTPWVSAWEDPGAPVSPLPMPLQGLLVRDPIVSAWEHGVDPVMGTPVGQIVGMLNRRTTVRDVMLELVEEFADSTQRLIALSGMDE
ncbi:nitronate monooxygenase [Aeromicrobium sp.]|jgi:NAD(P)H-dependent flavin oxidoreductase YrpB (nitropropane dioxygenase family)|uniref:nitronate monooxygenase n=1 Tax=Aeromicrobium sp. TaxID=1871063 RepID=UPI0025C016C7|nr:nitronate monooxygenase [Aeromicrobium sp.]MCK5890268.1 nitronate monooxygenase [Aeromicrobium sp.]